MAKTFGKYLKSLGILGWLLMGLNLFTALGAFELYTKTPTLQNFPNWGWLLFLIIGLLLAPFFAFRKVRLKLSQYEETEPKIVFEEVHESPLYRHMENEKGIPIYHVLQLWFKNKPIKPREKSIAKSLTADIEFWDKDAKQRLFRVSGQWVTSHQAPDFVGFNDTDNKIDMLPNDEYQKLLVALKWESDNDAYGYAKESFVYSQTMNGRDNGRKIPKGNFPIRIKLKGMGVDKEFMFILENPGSGGNLTMIEMPKNKRKRENQILNQEEFCRIINKASKPIKK